MKIAVQFYGHLRTFEQTYKSIQDNLLANYDCDIFIHTWDELQHRTKTWYDQGKDNMPVDDDCIKKIHKFYNPKRLLVEKQEIPEEDIILKSHTVLDSIMSLTGLRYLMYSQYKVNELRKAYQNENNLSYDYVVVIRPDVILFKTLNIEKFVCQQEFLIRDISQTRFCPCNSSGNSDSTILLKSLCATDILYFAKPEALNVHVSLYDKIKNNDQYLIDNFTTVEGLYYTHNRNNNIEMCLLSYIVEKDWSVVRFAQTESKKNLSKLKKYKKVSLKYILSILPYFMVKKKINKLKRQLKDDK